MIDILHVTPIDRIAVLQPEHAGCDVRRNVFDVVHDDRLFAASWHEDLDGFVVIAVRALVQGALDAMAVALPPGPKRDLPPRVPWGGGTMRAQWANWKKLSPVFGSKDLIWTDALSRVVVCWRPSSRISPGPVPRIELWSRY